MRYLYYTLIFVCLLPILIVLILLVYPKGNNDKPLIAIIDSGIDYNHEDLKNSIVKGFDFYSWDNDPMDEDGHGTHVAGIIHNIEPNAELLAIRVLKNKSKNSFSSSLGVFYAIIKRADVINMSFGSERKDPLTRLAVWIADKKGIILVASSGNEGLEKHTKYPAKFKGVLSVAMFDQTKRKINENSNLGKVDFVTPGVDIKSTDIGGGYKKKSGTSMASAYLTGTIAYIIGDGNTNKDEIIKKLKDSAIDVSHNEKDYHFVDAKKIKAEREGMTYHWLGSYDKVTKENKAVIPFVNVGTDEISILNNKTGNNSTIEHYDKEIVLSDLEEGYNHYTLRIKEENGIVHKKDIKIIKDTEFPEAIIETEYIKGKEYYLVTIRDWSVEKVRFGEQYIHFDLDWKYEKEPFIVTPKGNETEIIITDRSNMEKKYIVTKNKR